jgi:regulator of replication initiation timing
MEHKEAKSWLCDFVMFCRGEFHSTDERERFNQMSEWVIATLTNGNANWQGSLPGERIATLEDQLSVENRHSYGLMQKRNELRDEVAKLEAENAALKKRLEADLENCRRALRHETEAKCQALILWDSAEAENKEFEDILEGVAEVYCYITSGKISKPDTDPETVKSVYEQDCTDMVERETKMLTEENTELKKRLECPKVEWLTGYARVNSKTIGYINRDNLGWIPFFMDSWVGDYVATHDDAKAAVEAAWRELWNKMTGERK